MTAEDDGVADHEADPDDGADGGDRSGGWNHPEYRLPYVVTGLLAAGVGYVSFGAWGILGGFLVAQVVWMVLDRLT